MSNSTSRKINAHIKRLSEVQLQALVYLVIEHRGEWVEVAGPPNKREGMRRLAAYDYADEQQTAAPGRGRGISKFRSTSKGRKRLLDPEKLIP